MENLLRLNLLGSLQINSSKLLPVEFRTKARALLCYLAVENGRVPCSQLELLFWPQALERSSLHRELSILRKILPKGKAGLQLEYDTVQLQQDPHIWLDLECFHQALEQDNEQALIRAMKLYRGEFMAGFSLDSCPDFEEWLRLQRMIWQEKSILLLQRIIQKQRDVPNLLEFVQRLLCVEPWREDLHRYVMLILGRRKAWNAAIKHYETCRGIVAEELGLDPDPATLSLYKRILAARETPVAWLAKDRNLRNDYTGQVTEILQLLSDARHQLVTVMGREQMERAKVVRAVTHLKRNDYLEGIYFIAVDKVSHTESLLNSLSAGLSLPLENTKNVKQQILDYLRPREMLLLLEGLENAPSHAKLISDILYQAPEVQILITADRPLTMREEYVVTI